MDRLIRWDRERRGNGGIGKSGKTGGKIGRTDRRIDTAVDRLGNGETGKSGKADLGRRTNRQTDREAIAML